LYGFDFSGHFFTSYFEYIRFLGVRQGENFDVLGENCTFLVFVYKNGFAGLQCAFDEAQSASTGLQSAPADSNLSMNNLKSSLKTNHQVPRCILKTRRTLVRRFVREPDSMSFFCPTTVQKWGKCEGRDWTGGYLLSCLTTDNVPAVPFRFSY
jgi:hypothetical protein